MSLTPPTQRGKGANVFASGVHATICRLMDWNYVYVNGPSEGWPCLFVHWSTISIIELVQVFFLWVCFSVFLSFLVLSILQVTIKVNLNIVSISGWVCVYFDALLYIMRVTTTNTYTCCWLFVIYARRRRHRAYLICSSYAVHSGFCSIEYFMDKCCGFANPLNHSF